MRHTASNQEHHAGHTAITPAMRQRMLTRLNATGAAHLSPIVETLASRVAVLILPAGKLRFDAPRRRNWIALIGDDLATAQGPAAFHLRSLRKLLARANAAFIMVGAPVPAAYAAAADVAEAGLNVAIIETQLAEQASWVDFVHRHAPNVAKTLATPMARRDAA